MDGLTHNILSSVPSDAQRPHVRILADAMPHIVWTARPDGGRDYFNQRWYDYTGSDFERTKEWGWQSVFHPDDVQKCTLTWMQSLKTGTTYEVEARIRRGSDGEYRWHLGRAVAIRDEADHIIYWLGTCTDINDQKRTAERETLLNKIGEAIRETLAPEQVQSMVTQILGEAIGVDRCYFVSYTLSRDQIVIVHDWHRSDLPPLQNEYRGDDFRVLLGEILAGDDTKLIEDVRKTDCAASSLFVLEQLRIRSLISVPMYSKGVLAGTLVAAMADEPRVWTAAEATLVQDVAALARSAVELASIHQRERRIATTLQGTLQPTIPEHIPGLDLASYYRAALDEASVGGDFSDVFPVEKGCYSLVVGDLSGKGLEAAAQVATVRNMLRYALYTGQSVAEAITRLNSILVLNNLLSGFATLVVVTYDMGMKSLTYVSCGQEPALLRRTTNGEIEELPPTGPILGAFESAQYREQVIPLHSGDAFLLYTDGLTESGPNRREMLGVSGIANLMRSGGETAQELVTRIVGGASEYAHGVFSDDVCLLAGVVEANGHGL